MARSAATLYLMPRRKDKLLIFTAALVAELDGIPEGHRQGCDHQGRHEGCGAHGHFKPSSLVRVVWRRTRRKLRELRREVRSREPPGRDAQHARDPQEGPDIQRLPAAGPIRRPAKCAPTESCCNAGRWASCLSRRAISCSEGGAQCNARVTIGSPHKPHKPLGPPTSRIPTSGYPQVRLW